MKKLLFLAEAVSLAHVGRPLVLAQWAFQNGYEIHFACSSEGLKKAGIANLSFFTHSLTTISSTSFYSRVKKGRFFYTKEEMKTYVSEEIKLIEKVNPDLIISDFRLTASISAELCNKPLLNLSNAHWSPNADCPFPAPQVGFFKWLPKKISETLFSLIRPFAFRFFAEDLNKVRRHFGLEEKKDFRELYTDGSHTAYLDMPNFTKLSKLPKGHFFLGPIIWSAPIKNQNMTLPSTKNIYISMGSTGNNKLINPILKAVLKTDAFIILSGISSEEEADLLKRHENLKDRSLIKQLINPEEILGNCKLTICHGGSGTVYQSLAFGVPVLCFPSNPDQSLVSYAVKMHQLGSYIDIQNPSENSIFKAIQKCINNAQMIHNATTYSQKITQQQTENKWLQFLENLLPKKNITKDVIMKPTKRPSGVSTAFNQTILNLRKNEPIHEITPSRYTIKIANTLEERESAYRLAYQVYLDKGYVKENPHKWLVKNQDFNTETVTLIVQDKSKNTIGTVSMLFDGTEAIPAEAIYNEEIKFLKVRNEKIVEISRLAIDDNNRNAKEVLVLLFNYLYIYSYYVKKYTCLTIEVNPRHKEFYRSILCFNEIGAEKPCPNVQNAPAILLYTSLQHGANEIAKSQMTNIQKKNRNLFSHFLKPSQERLVAEYLQKQHKPMSTEEKIYFGFTDSTIGSILTV